MVPFVKAGHIIIIIIIIVIIHVFMAKATLVCQQIVHSQLHYSIKVVVGSM